MTAADARSMTEQSRGRSELDRILHEANNRIASAAKAGESAVSISSLALDTTPDMKRRIDSELRMRGFRVDWNDTYVHVKW